MQAPSGAPLPIDGPYAVTMGRLVPNKNFGMLIEAFARSRIAGKLLILGDGPERDALTRQVEALGLAGRVVMPGFSANPFPTLARADFYVSPSNAEGFPNSLLEAAYALGAPHWKVAMTVRLRAVKAGVVTGVLLAVARVSGETAPLLFTALNNQFFSTDMNAPMANLPVVIYQFAMSPYDDWRSLAWGGALLVTFTVLLLNILSRTLFSQKTPR